MDKVTLLPCPFCGAEAQLEHGSDHHGAWFNLGCSRHWGSGLVDPDDGCIGGHIFYTETETHEAEAITAWNTRATPAPDSEKLREALKTATGLASGPNGAGRMKVVIDGLEPGQEQKLHYLLSAALGASA